MPQLATIKEFLESNRDSYLLVLKDVRASCDKAKFVLGSDVIHHVYDRSDGSSNRAPFKSPDRILSSARRRGLRISKLDLIKLPDIAAVTVVLNFPDDLNRVICTCKEFLTELGFTCDEPYLINDLAGYHATHMICKRVEGGLSYTCELQFKTMLHDAWGSKMHSLTYNPSGFSDPKAAAVLETIGRQIQCIEEQSILLREIIRSGWDVEQTTRQIARSELFETVLKYDSESWERAKSEEIAELDQFLKNNIDHLRGCEAGDPELNLFLDRLRRACDDRESLRLGWIVAGKLASERAGSDLNNYFSSIVDSWLTVLAEDIANGKVSIVAHEDVIEHSDAIVSEQEVSAIGLMYYVTGDLDGAIGIISQILDDNLFAENLSQSAKFLLSFNRATFIVEREYYEPTVDEEARTKLSEEVSAIIFSEEANSKDHLQASIVDTQGLFKIAFANSTNEIREGIELCVGARSLTPKEEEDLSDAYADLHLRLGWRRFFDFDNLSERRNR